MPILATELRNVRIVTSAVDEMRMMVHTKTMRELGSEMIRRLLLGWNGVEETRNQISANT